MSRPFVEYLFLWVHLSVQLQHIKFKAMYRMGLGGAQRCGKEELEWWIHSEVIFILILYYKHISLQGLDLCIKTFLCISQFGQVHVFGYPSTNMGKLLRWNKMKCWFQLTIICFTVLFGALIVKRDNRDVLIWYNIFLK